MSGILELNEFDPREATLRSERERVAGNFAGECRWFAVWTKSRQEKVAAAMIDSLGVTNYLPLKAELRQWSDRRQTIKVPLFSGYLFVKMNPLSPNKIRILNVPGVAGFVGNSRGPLPIPDHQIEAVRTVVSQGIDCTIHPLTAQPLFEEGDLVRVVRGALAGVEGRLVRVNSSSRLVISIEMIHHSIAVSISRGDVELVRSCAA
jgi:transcription antitermination factor NusG